MSASGWLMIIFVSIKERVEFSEGSIGSTQTVAPVRHSRDELADRWGDIRGCRAGDRRTDISARVGAVAEQCLTVRYYLRILY